MKSYLQRRSQVVGIKTEGGKILWTASNGLRGVPQGCILGPLLFNIYVNDFCGLFGNDCNVVIESYADDTSLLIKADSYEHLILQASLILDTIQTWFQQNTLVLNKSKTEFV